MTCINWVRVRKGARPAGPRLEIEQLRTIAACVTGELVDFCCLFVLFYCYFTRAAPTETVQGRKSRSWIFFLSFITEKSGNRVSNCVTLGVVSGAVEAAATTEPAAA